MTKIIFVLAMMLAGFAQAGTVQKLLANDGAANDKFGYAVAADGGTVLIGASGDDNGKGAVYIFVRRPDGTYEEKQKLNADDGVSGDGFGVSVALDDDTALIGAEFNDVNKGAVYVFVRGIDGTWILQQKLITPDNQGDANQFGHSVSIDGDTALIGAILNDHNGLNWPGAAYIFTRIGGSWISKQKLVAPDPNHGDYFGNSVSLDGNTALIGAYFKDRNGTQFVIGAGAVYVFIKDAGGSWAMQQKLVSSKPIGYEEFGWSVSLDGNTALIGTKPGGAYPNSPEYGGAAYVFTRTGSSWTEQARLTASDADFLDMFGCSVSLDGNTALIGAFDDDEITVNGLGNAGAAYIFTRTGDDWIEQKKLIAPDGNSGDRFGRVVSLSGGIALIGVSEDDDKGNYSGSAYIFNGNNSAQPRSPLLPAMYQFLLKGK